MGKYYVSFKLEIRKYDDEQIKTEGILYETADTVTATPDKYIKNVLKGQATKLAELMKKDVI